MKRLYPGTKCAIGPSIAEGFYYDFDFDFHFSEENFAELIHELPENEETSFSFKLLSVAGAYRRGDDKNKMLTRIYGTSFPDKAMLEEYLNQLEEAKKRDHRKLGKELDLFALFEEGPGFPFFLPKGLILKNLLIDYWRRLHTREGYLDFLRFSAPKGFKDTLPHTGILAATKILLAIFLKKAIMKPYQTISICRVEACA